MTPRWLPWLFVMTLTGCVHHAAPKATTEAQGPRADAAKAAVFGDEGEAPLIDALEVRVRQLSEESFSEGDGFTYEARLPLENPWRAQAEAEMIAAEIGARIARLDRATLEDAVTLCRTQVSKSALLEEAWRHKAWSTQAEALQTWAEGWSAQGSDAVDTLTLRLDLGLTLLDAPQPPTNGLESTLLPLVSDSPPLAGEVEVVIAMIEHHPDLEALRADEEGAKAGAARSEAELLPWLDFVELSYQQGAGISAGLEGQLALVIPFGIEARNDLKRWEADAQAASLGQEARRLEARDATLEALQRLRHFEAKGPKLQALELLAGEAEALLTEWLEAGLGTPRQLGRLLDASDDVHRAILNARREASSAACDLLEESGVSLADWPRKSGIVGE